MAKKMVSVLAGSLLALVFAATAFAADYSSEIGVMGASVLGNITDNTPAIIASGLLVFGALASIGILFKALRKTPAKG